MKWSGLSACITERISCWYKSRDGENLFHLSLHHLQVAFWHSPTNRRRPRKMLQQDHQKSCYHKTTWSILLFLFSKGTWSWMYHGRQSSMLELGSTWNFEIGSGNNENWQKTPRKRTWWRLPSFLSKTPWGRKKNSVEFNKYLQASLPTGTGILRKH